MGDIEDEFDDSMPRHIAIKLMYPEHAALAPTVACLHREAMAVNIIRCPSVV